MALPGSGVFAVNGALSTGTLSISASSAQLGGTGTVTVTSGGSWTVGTMGGTGTTRIVSGASFTVNPANTGYLTLVGTGRHLVNDGTVTVQGSPSWYFAQGSSLANTGTLLLTGTGTLSNYASGTGGVPVLTNTGLVRRTAGSGAVWLAVVNSGTITADPGLSVELVGGDGGTASAGSYTNVGFDGGAFTIGPGSQLGGAITVGAGSLTDNATASQSIDTLAITAPGSFIANGLLSTTSLQLSGSSAHLDGTGTLTLTGSGTWSGGSMSGTGITRIAPGGTLTMQDSTGVLNLLTDRSIVNLGTVSWSAGGYGIYASDSTQIRNQGTWAMPVGGSLHYTAGGGVRLRVTNVGTWVQSSGTGSCECDFDNQGVVRIDAGTYDVTSALINYDSTKQLLTGGHYQLTGLLRAPALNITTLAADVNLNGTAAGFTNTFSQSALRSLNVIKGAGRLALTGGATFSTPAALSSSGAVSLTGTSALTIPGGFTQTGGSTTLADTGSHLNAASTLSGGTLSGLGTVTGTLTNTAGTVLPGVAGAGTLTITGGYTQGPAGELDLDVTGSAADRLAVTGAATLDGTVRFATDPTSPPATGTSWPVLSDGARTGGFAQVLGASLGNGTRWWLSDPGGELDATVQPDTVADLSTTLTINGGAARTMTRTVSQANTVAPGVSVSGMRLSNDADPTGAFVTYSASGSWTLGPADGTRQVRLQLRDALGNLGTVKTASIVLDTTAPVATITTPTGSGGSARVTFNETVTGVTTSNIVLRVSGASANLRATLICRDASTTVVDCATAAVRTVDFIPTGALVPAVPYQLTVNPSDAPSLIADLAGNHVALTTANFTV